MQESLTPLNYPLVLQALVDLLERAAAHAAKGMPLASTTSAGGVSGQRGPGSPLRVASQAASVPIQQAGAALQGQGQGAGLAGADSGTLGAAGGSDPAIANLLHLLKQSGRQDRLHPQPCVMCLLLH